MLVLVEGFVETLSLTPLALWHICVFFGSVNSLDFRVGHLVVGVCPSEEPYSEHQNPYTQTNTFLHSCDSSKTKECFRFDQILLLQ